MNKNINVNRALMGDHVSTQEVVRKDGKIVSVRFEKHTHNGADYFQFLVYGNMTNYVGYTTLRKAINAAAKTEC